MLKGGGLMKGFSKFLSLFLSYRIYIAYICLNNNWFAEDIRIYIISKIVLMQIIKKINPQIMMLFRNQNVEHECIKKIKH